MSLVDTDWLEKNINQVKIIDCSWHMPAENMNADVKDYIFSEFDDGDGVLNEEERKEVMKMMGEHRKNNQ